MWQVEIVEMLEIFFGWSAGIVRPVEIFAVFHNYSIYVPMGIVYFVKYNVRK